MSRRPAPGPQHDEGRRGLGHRSPPRQGEHDRHHRQQEDQGEALPDQPVEHPGAVEGHEVVVELRRHRVRQRRTEVPGGEHDPQRDGGGRGQQERPQGLRPAHPHEGHHDGGHEGERIQLVDHRQARQRTGEGEATVRRRQQHAEPERSGEAGLHAAQGLVPEEPLGRQDHGGDDGEQRPADPTDEDDGDADEEDEGDEAEDAGGALHPGTQGADRPQHQRVERVAGPEDVLVVVVREAVPVGQPLGVAEGDGRVVDEHRRAEQPAEKPHGGHEHDADRDLPPGTEDLTGPAGGVEGGQRPPSGRRRGADDGELQEQEGEDGGAQRQAEAAAVEGHDAEDDGGAHGHQGSEVGRIVGHAKAQAGSASGARSGPADP